MAGNIETPHKTAAFTITAPVPVDTTAPVTTSDAKATYVSSAAIKLTATDAGAPAWRRRTTSSTAAPRSPAPRSA